MTELNNTKNIIKIIEWIIFIGLCILSVFLTHEVLVQFLLKRTSFKIYEEKITDHPTITICYSGDQKEYHPKIEFGSNFDIDITINEAYKHISLEDGENYYENLNQTIVLEKLITIYEGICHKINFTSDSHINGVFRTISVRFENLSVPEQVKFTFSSENNSYGRFWNLFLEGEFFETNIGKNIEFQSISIKATKYQYINAKSKCSDESFFKCFDR